jgi:hypothetical protein
VSWLYAQTWLWYLIAFLVGVLLAWLFLVLPQQRRLRTLQGIAGTAVDHDLYAESRAAAGAGAASGAALFDSTADGGAAASVDDPATDQFRAVDAEPGDSSDTTELPVQPAPDDTETGEIPAVTPGAGAEADSTDGTAAEMDGDSTGAGARAAEPTSPPVDTAEEIDDSAAESNGRATAAVMGAGAAGFVPARGGADAADDPGGTGTAGADTVDAADVDPATAGTTAADLTTADAAPADSTTADPTTADSTTADSTTADSTTADSATADGTAADDAATDAKTNATETNGSETNSSQTSATQTNGTETSHPEAGNPGINHPEASPAEAPAQTHPAEAPDAAAHGEAGAGGAHAGAQGLLTAPVAVAPGPYQGSALAGPEGAAPGAEYTIKGNEDSMLFHTPDSPYYGRTKAEVWFRDPADAEAAGFTSWTRNK